MLSRDIIVRAFKTFVQGFLAALALSAANIVDLNSAKAALIAAVAAGISAVWNTILYVR